MHLSLTVESILSSDLMFEKTFAFDLAGKVIYEIGAEVAIMRWLDDNAADLKSNINNGVTSPAFPSGDIPTMTTPHEGSEAISSRVRPKGKDVSILYMTRGSTRGSSMGNEACIVR